MIEDRLAYRVPLKRGRAGSLHDLRGSLLETSHDGLDIGHEASATDIRVLDLSNHMFRQHTATGVM